MLVHVVHLELSLKMEWYAHNSDKSIGALRKLNEYYHFVAYSRIFDETTCAVAAHRLNVIGEKRAVRPTWIKIYFCHICQNEYSNAFACLRNLHRNLLCDEQKANIRVVWRAKPVVIVIRDNQTTMNTKWRNQFICRLWANFGVQICRIDYSSMESN